MECKEMKLICGMMIHSAKFRRFSLSVGMLESHFHDVLGNSITTWLFMQPT